MTASDTQVTANFKLQNMYFFIVPIRGFPLATQVSIRKGIKPLRLQFSWLVAQG